MSGPNSFSEGQREQKERKLKVVMSAAGHGDTPVWHGEIAQISTADMYRMQKYDGYRSSPQIEKTYRALTERNACLKMTYVALNFCCI